MRNRDNFGGGGRQKRVEVKAIEWKKGPELIHVC